MIKYYSFYTLLLVFTILSPVSITSVEDNLTNTKKMEEDIPLPPSLREYSKKELPKEDHFVGEFFKMLLTLGGIVALMLLASFLLKRFNNTRIQQINESSSIKILERRAITAKTAVYLLTIRGKDVAVFESHNGLLLIPEIPQEEEI